MVFRILPPQIIPRRVKKYVDSKTTGGSGGGLSDSGFTMKGDINMGGYEVIGVYERFHLSIIP